MGLFELLGWAVALAFSVFVGWGLTILAPPHDNFRGARVCFYCSALILWGFAVAWGVRSKYALPVTLAVVAVIAAAAAIGLVLALRTVAHREREAKSVPTAPPATAQPPAQSDTTPEPSEPSAPSGHRVAVDSAAEKVKQLKLLIECRFGMMPAAFPASGDIYNFEIRHSDRGTGAGLARRFGPPGADTGMKSRVAYRCDVTNYATEPLVNVTIAAAVTFMKFNPDGNSTSARNAFAKSEGRIVISKIEPGASGKFSFYVDNPSEYPVSLAFGDKATGQFLSDDKQIEIGVVSAGEKIDTLFPQPYS